MSLIFDNISHNYGDTSVLKDVSLTARAGEILCLLGPSGCGKTTLLNLAAGVLKLQGGRIILDETILATAQDCPPPEKRPVGLVFQDGALFPHLSVEENIEFGIHKQPNRKEVSSSLLTQIGLSELKTRFPHSLSGGQQQRVAVARSLAPNPRVILMDEPFANIDIILRRRLREEIRHLLKAQNCITIMVTHDPEEAMEIGDNIAVMLNGAIAQIGRPQDIYFSPVSPEVAKLTSEGNIILGSFAGQNIKTDFGDWPLASVSNHVVGMDSKKISLFIRPFSLDLKPVSKTSLPLDVIDVRHTGREKIICLTNPSGKKLSLHMGPEVKCNIGQTLSLRPKPSSLLAFIA